MSIADLNPARPYNFNLNNPYASNAPSFSPAYTNAYNSVAYNSTVQPNYGSYTTTTSNSATSPRSTNRNGLANRYSYSPYSYYNTSSPYGSGYAPSSTGTAATPYTTSSYPNQWYGGSGLSNYSTYSPFLTGNTYSPYGTTAPYSSYYPTTYTNTTGSYANNVTNTGPLSPRARSSYSNSGFLPGSAYYPSLGALNPNPNSYPGYTNYANPGTNALRTSTFYAPSTQGFSGYNTPSYGYGYVPPVTTSTTTTQTTITPTPQVAPAPLPATYAMTPRASVTAYSPRVARPSFTNPIPSPANFHNYYDVDPQFYAYNPYHIDSSVIVQQQAQPVIVEPPTVQTIVPATTVIAAPTVTESVFLY